MGIFYYKLPIVPNTFTFLPEKTLLKKIEVFMMSKKVKTGTQKKHIIVKSIYLSLRSESNNITNYEFILHINSI